MVVSNGPRLGAVGKFPLRTAAWHCTVQLLLVITSQLLCEPRCKQCFVCRARISCGVQYIISVMPTSNARRYLWNGYLLKYQRLTRLSEHPPVHLSTPTSDDT